MATTSTCQLDRPRSTTDRSDNIGPSCLICGSVSGWPLNRTRRLHYQGPWRLPGPDSHRLAIESLRSLRHDNSFAVMAPASCWNNVDRG